MRRNLFRQIQTAHDKIMDLNPTMTERLQLEKEMATHSSVLAWRIPGTGKPGGLLSMGSHRVRLLKRLSSSSSSSIISSQGYGFSSGHVWMWELDCEEGWAPKNWCSWTVLLEKTFESPLNCKEIQPIHRKGNQSWIFSGRTDTEAEIPILWPPDAKN